MQNLEQTIISKIKNLKHFDNILGTCEKGWDIDQTIQNHLY